MNKLLLILLCFWFCVTDCAEASSARQDVIANVRAGSVLKLDLSRLPFEIADEHAVEITYGTESVLIYEFDGKQFAVVGLGLDSTIGRHLLNFSFGRKNKHTNEVVQIEVTPGHVFNAEKQLEKTATSDKYHPGIQHPSSLLRQVTSDKFHRGNSAPPTLPLISPAKRRISNPMISDDEGSQQSGIEADHQLFELHPGDSVVAPSNAIVKNIRQSSDHFYMSLDHGRGLISVIVWPQSGITVALNPGDGVSQNRTILQTDGQPVVSGNEEVIFLLSWYTILNREFVAPSELTQWPESTD